MPKVNNWNKKHKTNLQPNDLIIDYHIFEKNHIIIF